RTVLFNTSHGHSSEYLRIPLFCLPCVKQITANVKHVGIILSIMEGGFPFEIKQPRYNKEKKAAILEARSISSGEIKARRLAEEI
ncbi:MAG: hypothetical protein J6D57_07565, partial [Mogibacterium sp.]|nr:hypothetical protein [Mogibacterium sp.]